MTTLFLIRHGLTAVTGSRLYGRTGGIHLDERGRRQATALVERLEGVRLTALYSSPLERCTETLQPLATARGLEIRTSDGLIEMDAGDWTGRTLPSLRRTKLWDTVQRSPSRFHFPSGESFVEAEARLLARGRADRRPPPARAGGRGDARGPRGHVDLPLRRRPPRPVPARDGGTGLGLRGASGRGDPEDPVGERHREPPPVRTGSSGARHVPRTPSVERRRPREGR